METNKIIGILIILALILSIVFASFSFVTGSDQEELKSITLNQSQLNESNIKTVNINVDKYCGGVDFNFVNNSSSIVNVSTKDQSPNMNYTVNGSTLNVYLNSNSSDDTIELNNKYEYNINQKIILGGSNLNVSQGSKINSLNNYINLGGINIVFGGGELKNVYSQINTGGLNIMGTSPKGISNINSFISTGGFNVRIDNPVVELVSYIGVGGNNIANAEKIDENHFKSLNYNNSSSDKLRINSDIEVGGFNF
ncbi:hypothetical protein BGI41_07235 [Methanobrevibacter sp. 87.7]|uniref:hypothetical protein n=1 Tax=Methanobrevibacter sp. 87.7 TaxID=387957 RepID=UPI000B50B1EE|nr:hypothetical protein [Methanobrevibacter sp. 87.7]OWT32521.1 hypothetical protein BGI41_07235 [Methanobrevibacter sp. 87.7]